MLASSHTLSLREACVAGVWAHLLLVKGKWGEGGPRAAVPRTRAGGSSLDTVVRACRLSLEPATQWS